MKILPYLLINLVMVGGGIVVYDQLKSDDVGSGISESATMDAVDLAQLEDRIVERLGNADQPVLRASGVDARMAARVAALEKRLGAKGPQAPAAATDGDGGSTKSEDPGFAMADPVAGGEGEPSEDEVKRFRKVMERAEKLRREEREVERMQQMLARLEIDLNPEQQEKLITAQRAYRAKIGETMRTAFQGGGGREAAREAMEGLRAEYTTTLTEFLSVGDAQKISESGGRGMGSIMRGGGGAGRRGR